MWLHLVKIYPKNKCKACPTITSLKNHLTKAARNPLVIKRLLHDIFIKAFKQYYSPKIDFYTHVAIDLSYGEELENNIDTLAKLLMYGLHYQEKKTVKEAIRLSRHKKYCIRFNEPTYIDLGNFYDNLLTHIASCSLSNDQDEVFKKKLHTVLTNGLDLIHKAVKANEVGSKHEHASGISIYFPEFIIHRSYKNNEFAKRTHWLKFLQEYVAL